MAAVGRAFPRWYERIRPRVGCRCSLSLIVHVILISGRDLPDIQGRGILSLSLPLSVFSLTRRTIRSWFIPGAAGRSDKGATSGSPFIFHLSPPASIAQGMTSYPPGREAANWSRPRGRSASTLQWISNFCQIFFFTTEELRAITRETARGKSCPKKKQVFFFYRSVGKLASKRQMTAFIYVAYLWLIFIILSADKSWIIYTWFLTDKKEWRSYWSNIIITMKLKTLSFLEQIFLKWITFR